MAQREQPIDNKVFEKALIALLDQYRELQQENERLKAQLFLLEAKFNLTAK